MLKETWERTFFSSLTNASPRTIHWTGSSIGSHWNETPKMKTRIGSHNKSVLSAYTTQTPAEQHDTCNCRRKPERPLDGKCLQTNVIYQAIVTSTDTTTDSYVGLAANFKQRVRNYQSSFWHASKRNETELSKYVWTLKDCKMPDKIKWAMLKKCLPYNLSTFLRNVVWFLNALIHPS